MSANGGGDENYTIIWFYLKSVMGHSRTVH